MEPLLSFWTQWLIAAVVDMTAILAAAKRADAIVMTTVGRTGLGHFLMGSVAEKVVRHATVPVLTLHPGAAKRLAGRLGAAKRR